MIVIFKEDKIIAIEKSLLQLLNISLENINEILSTLKLSLSALNKTALSIGDKTFNIKEVSLISVEDIKIYDLQIIQTQENIITSPLAQEPKLETQTTELPPLGEDLLKTESNELPPLAQEPKLETQTTELPPLGEDLLKTESNELPPLEGGIQLTFCDEFEEIRELLNMDEKEVAQLFKEDLDKASQDLGIDLPTLEELSKELIKQIEESKGRFQKALSKKDYEQLHKISHSLKGAALNLRLSNLALILKTIDEKSKTNEEIENIKTLIEKFYELVNNIKPVIYKELPENKYKFADIHISDEVKMLINKTIQRYLTTQNEKQLKKDLRYIQTILGVEINSIEDLKNIVKGRR